MTKIYTVLYTLLFLAFSSIVNGQIKSGSVSIGSGTTQMDMTVTMNTNTSTVSFSITGPASRWFAFGFGASSMSTSAYTILSNASAQIAKEYNQAIYKRKFYYWSYCWFAWIVKRFCKKDFARSKIDKLDSSFHNYYWIHIS